MNVWKGSKSDTNAPFENAPLIIVGAAVHTPTCRNITWLALMPVLSKLIAAMLAQCGSTLEELGTIL